MVADTANSDSASAKANPRGRAAMSAAERDLADLRAALAVTLRMVRRGKPIEPDGLTPLSVPSDREIIDEVHRLRAIADLTDERADPAQLAGSRSDEKG